MSVDLHEGGDIRTAKRIATPVDDIRQHVPRHLVVRHEFPDHLHGQIGIREIPPRSELGGRHGGEGVGDEETAIVRKAAHDDGPERQVGLGRTSPRRGIRDGFAAAIIVVGGIGGGGGGRLAVHDKLLLLLLNGLRKEDFTTFTFAALSWTNLFCGCFRDKHNVILFVRG